MLEGQSIEEYMAFVNADARRRHVMEGYLEATPEEEAQLNQTNPGWKIIALMQKLNREKSSLYTMEGVISTSSDDIARQRAIVNQLEERISVLRMTENVVAQVATIPDFDACASIGVLYRFHGQSTHE